MLAFPRPFRPAAIEDLSRSLAVCVSAPASVISSVIKNFFLSFKMFE